MFDKPLERSVRATLGFPEVLFYDSTGLYARPFEGFYRNVSVAPWPIPLFEGFDDKISIKLPVNGGEY